MHKLVKIAAIIISVVEATRRRRHKQNATRAAGNAAPRQSYRLTLRASGRGIHVFYIYRCLFTRYRTYQGIFLACSEEVLKC